MARLFEVLETISRVYLVMEVAPFGEMFTRITNQGRYEEAAAQQLFSQLVSAIEFMVMLGKRSFPLEHVFCSSIVVIRFTRYLIVRHELRYLVGY